MHITPENVAIALQAEPEERALILRDNAEALAKAYLATAALLESLRLEAQRREQEHDAELEDAVNEAAQHERRAGLLLERLRALGEVAGATPIQLAKHKRQT